MRNSTRTRKAREQDGARHLAVAPLATAPQYLRACREASRSHALTIYPLADCSIHEHLCSIHGWSAASGWTGQAERKGRKLTGESHPACCPQCRTDPVDSRDRSTAYQLDSVYPAERAALRKQFAQVVHLRGISGATFNLMTGQTTRLDEGCPDELAYGCIAQVPSDNRYSEKMLIRTRKGRKLVQRPTKQRQIEIESAYQIAQAGPLFTDRADAMHLEGIEQSERITIEQARPGHYERQQGKLIKIERQQPYHV